MVEIEEIVEPLVRAVDEARPVAPLPRRNAVRRTPWSDTPAPRDAEEFMDMVGLPFPRNAFTNGARFLLIAIYLFPLLKHIYHPLEFECNKDIIVALDGTGNYSSIRQALTVVPTTSDSTLKFCVFIKAGVYTENIYIWQENVVLQGEGMERTIIRSDLHYGTGINRGKSATVEVLGNGFMAIDVTFENVAGAEKVDAVAISSISDCSVFLRSSFRSYQNTLYIKHNRQYFKDCVIYGSHFIIYGDARALFYNSTIYVRQSLDEKETVVTYQERSNSSGDTGFVFLFCRIQAAPQVLQTVGRTYLGAAAMPYSRVIITNSLLDEIISPAGWITYNGSFINTVSYGEFHNHGKGAVVSNRVKWSGFKILNKSETAQFSAKDFLGGDEWLPSTGIPYLGAYPQ